MNRTRGKNKILYGILTCALVILTGTSVYGWDVTNTSLIATPANYTPGGQVVISGSFEFTLEGGDPAFGPTFQLPPGWTYEELSGTTSSGTPFFLFVAVSETLNVAFIGLPVSPMTFSFTVNVPADDEDPVNIVGRVVNVNEVEFALLPNPLVINPPPGPTVANLVPATTDLANNPPVTNMVTAGQDITFSVDVTSPINGVALNLSDFSIGPGIFQDGEWGLDFNDITLFPSNLAGGEGEDDDLIDFSVDDDNHPDDGDGNTDGAQNTIGELTHTIVWDTIAGTVDGKRKITWSVPLGLVTKCGGETDVYVIEIAAGQDNGGFSETLWAVKVLPVNNTPTITAPTVNGQDGTANPFVIVEDDTNPYLFAVTGNDLDGCDVVAGLTYRWFKNNVEVAAPAVGNNDEPIMFGTGTTVHPAPNSLSTVRVDVSDGTLPVASFTFNLQVNDVDQQPPAPTVVITPAAPLTTNDLVATITNQAADPDGDAITYLFSWDNTDTGGVDEAEPGTTAGNGLSNTLDSSKTRKAHNWEVTVTSQTNPYNAGLVNSTLPPVNVAKAIGNSLPSAIAQGVFIPQGQGIFFKDITLAGTDDDVTDGTEVLNFAISDPADPVFLDVDLAGDFITSGKLTINIPPGKQGEEFTETFGFKVSDPVGDSAEVLVTVQHLSNVPPFFELVTPNDGGVIEPLDQAVTETGNAIVFTAKASDAGDPTPGGAEMASIDWFLSNAAGAFPGVATESDGIANSGTATFTFTPSFTTIGPGQRNQQETFRLRARAIDNQGGTTDLEWEIVVTDVDRDPPAAAISVTDPALTTNNLVVTIDTIPVDPDGDPITGYAYAWKKNGTLAGAEVTNTVNFDKTKKNETWQAEVKAKTNPYGAGEVTSANAITDQVTIGNTPPTATAQPGLDVLEESPLAIQLVGFDPDVVDLIDTLTFATGGGPLQGTFTVALDPVNGTLTYRGNTDFSGADQFTFTVTDGTATSAPAAIDIDVEAVNDPPKAIDQAGNVRLQTNDPLTDLGNAIFITITLTGTDADAGATIDFFNIASTAGLTQGEVLLGYLTRNDGTPTPANGGLTDGTEIDADGNQAILRFYPALAGEGQSPITGAAIFTYSATDDGLPQPAKKSDTDGTVTIGVGTPSWMPVEGWVDPNGNEGSQYNVTIKDDQGTEVMATTVTGRTFLLPIDYINGGSHGLPPADDYMITVVPFTNLGQPDTDTPLRNDTFDIDEYNEATATSVAGGAAVAQDDIFKFTFITDNASGFRLQVFDNVNATGIPYLEVTEFFPVDPDTGLVEFVGPFMRNYQLVGNGGANLYWRVCPFNPNVAHINVVSLSTDGLQAFGPYSDAVPLGATVFPGPANVGPCTTAPTAPILEAEPDQTAITTDTATNTLEVDLNWGAVPCATAYFLRLRNYTTGETVFANFSGWTDPDTKTKPIASYTFEGDNELEPGRYVWRVTASNTNSDANLHSPPSVPDQFFVLANAASGDGGLIGNLTAPDTSDDANDPGGVDWGGTQSRPVWRLRANNANAFQFRIYDFRRRKLTTTPPIPNVVEGTLWVAGAGQQTVFVGAARIRTDQNYRVQVRALNYDPLAEKNIGLPGPWSRALSFQGE